MKLRGAGNILGINQSGHIAAVGYEMYLEILQRAIQELKGEPVYEEVEPEIKIPIMAYIPQTYISDQTQRVTFYKRLSQVRDLNELQDLQTEMKDRYGQLPQVVENLFQLIQIKLWCRRLAIKRLDTKDGLLRVYFHSKTPISSEKIVNFLKTHPSYSFTDQNALLIPLKKEHIFKKLEKTIQSLEEMI
ncbi:Transcription-repair-coupling factor [Candidatus Methanoperedenaceae archaeon GB50]|nr:Transcription-repair-coupling factor [Candidatus Methanoperedenaceae archaeon GB50]